jgi:chaperonin cofactor prefoldin
MHEFVYRLFKNLYICTKIFNELMDDRGELDLERRIEELTNENLILQEQKEILELRIKYLQQQIRKYSGKENI